MPTCTAVLLSWLLALTGMAAASDATVLHIHPQKRYLCLDDGSPFFYLGDTAWELFHRLDRAEADAYLSDRAAKGFTVIQAVVLAEFGGLTVPNRYGQLPLTDNDPTQPVEAYFQHVDYIVAKAASLGLFIGMLPTWGDKWNKKWGEGPEIFTPANAASYGEWLGRRYKDQPIIWILGGDRPIETDQHRAIITALANGLRRGDEGRHLITFHPNGQQHSAHFFPDASWLDMNMVQTGHTYDRDNYRDIAQDYAALPIKPTLDGEPGYEDHPSGFKAANGYMNDSNVRAFAYWALFSGACGHTYGCHDIWQFYQAGRTPVTAARTPWREAINLPGASQVGYARFLIESRPYFTRVPDQALVTDGPASIHAHVVATSDRDARQHATYIMVYLPTPAAVTIDTSIIDDDTLRVWWFDPRTGVAHDLGERANAKRLTPGPAPDGGDWVLVIDAHRSAYPTPGAHPR